MDGVTVCTYNVHSFYDEEGRCRVEDIAAMFNQLKPDIICLQESSGMHLSKLVKLLSPAHSVVKWGGCSILSSLPMEEVEVRPREMVAGLPGRRSYHPRFTTARVQVGEGRSLCVTCLHLDHKLEPRRMKEVVKIQELLAGVFKSGEPQTSVTSTVTSLGFTDCWAAVGRPGSLATCRSTLQAYRAGQADTCQTVNSLVFH